MKRIDELWPRPKLGGRLWLFAALWIAALIAVGALVSGCGGGDPAPEPRGEFEVRRPLPGGGQVDETKGGAR